MMRKKLLWYSLFFVLLIGGFLFFTFFGTDMWHKQLPVLSDVKPFRFTAQDSTDFTERDMEGKVSVVEYFFTSCRGICPRLNTNMRAIYADFKDRPDFQIVSHTCDPDRDSVPVLRHYADSLGASRRNWIFLTGRKDSLYQAARQSYLLDDPHNNVADIRDQFLHTQFFALVDRQGRVRGEIYDGLKKDDLARLRENINVLLRERRAVFTGNGFGSNP